MKINYDYSYIGSNKELIQKGCAELDIHSINFDRYFSEEEKENNMKESKKLTKDQWNKRCEETSIKIFNQILPIVELLNNKYDIHQITKEKSTLEHYGTNWDLYFWSNKGWNNKEYYDHIKLNFNDKKTTEENKKLLDKILRLLEKTETKNVYCRVQYTIRINEEEIIKKSTEICESLLGKTIDYKGMKGKIKIVNHDDNKKIYGFFKNRATKKYYTISESYMVLNF